MTSMKNPWKLLIYGLVDPRTRETRYIGKSSNGLRRPKFHWSKPALRDGRAPCDHWIRKLVSMGLVPEIDVIEDLGFSEDKDDANRKLNEAEIRCISKFRDDGKKLLNVTDGGDGLLGRKHTDEEIRKITEARRKRRSGMLGKKHSEEAKEKIRIAHLRRANRVADDGSILPLAKRERKSQAGEKNHFFGKKHSEESLRKMRDMAKKRGDEFRKLQSIAHSKRVRCIDDGLVFVSTNDAGKYYGISPGNVAVCARGLKKSGMTKGKRFVYEDQEN